MEQPKIKRHKHPKRHSKGTCGAVTLRTAHLEQRRCIATWHPTGAVPVVNDAASGTDRSARFWTWDEHPASPGQQVTNPVDSAKLGWQARLLCAARRHSRRGDCRLAPEAGRGCARSGSREHATFGLCGAFFFPSAVVPLCVIWWGLGPPPCPMCLSKPALSGFTSPAMQGACVRWPLVPLGTGMPLSRRPPPRPLKA